MLRAVKPVASHICHGRVVAAACLAALWSTTVDVRPTPAQTVPGCSQPVTTGAQPAASDCLLILQTAVGVASCDPECICAPKGSLPASATDALLCLSAAVGQSVELDCPCGPFVVQGVLPPTNGRFNYASMIGVPGAGSECAMRFAGTHVCTYAELLVAETAGDLVGITDSDDTMVTSFWAIDPARPDVDQCTVNVAWDYQTAHTRQFADRTILDNAAGTLAPMVSGVRCGTQSWVGCCS